MSTEIIIGTYGIDKATSEAGIAYHRYWGYNQVSVKIQQWEATKNGVKLGKVAVTVSGSPYKGDQIMQKASEVIEMLNAGTWTGEKTVIINPPKPAKVHEDSAE